MCSSQNSSATIFSGSTSVDAMLAFESIFDF